ncbi:hypothetical protein AB0P12_28815 [Streptomyces subrutilus]|uniref:Uncharacterized protein n=1 Tax=Streptomyces subrutilus TaxID=36818 RepID=A0A5P2UEH9_9ACTN|nr:hypothetical protein [Streptomyces subrutilus]QEU77696.1 hypothetical protein CP968_04845 [Streptomyces subrutilus]WSJ33200.1 hypothetical protein OG479_30045 [Streptomyces subrutilus]GGZ65371.1 hypothetical protein GCM10010371_26400 [Streptomyces subrutilus]
MLGLTPGTDEVTGSGTAGTRTLELSEILTRPEVFKCMGRSYSVLRREEAVVIQDITDITRPLLLGTAEPGDTGLWDLRTPQGLAAGRTCGTLQAIAALRAAAWPPRDPFAARRWTG